MATPSKLPHPAPGSGSGGASFAGDSGMEHANLAVGLGNPGVIMTSELDSYECSVTRKGQPVLPDFEIVPIDCHNRVMTCAAAETFDCHELSSAFCLMIAKTKLPDGRWLDADVNVFGAKGRKLQAQDKDQLAEVDSYECSVARRGQPFPSHHETVSTDRHTRVMAYAAGDTFDCHEQPCAFWLTDAHNTFYAKQVNETEKRTVAAGFEATTDIDITKTKLTGGYWLNADVTDFGATGKPLKALDKDQLAEGIGAVMEYGQREKICPGKNVSPLKLYSTMKVKYVDPSMIYARQLIEMIGKVARLKQPVSSLELSSDSGISAYPMHVTKSMSPLRRVGQVSLFLLFIVLSASQVSSSAEAKTESAEIGSCRFDLTSLAALSCVEPDGSWRPPSTSCCNALLRAIDHLPASNESGACCLCRYISKKYHHFALATSYVLCKGKDTSVITTWSSVPHHCYMACHRRNASSHGLDTTAAVLGTHSKDFSRIPWIAALIVASFCAIFLACFFYRRRYKPIPTGESHPLNLQRRVSPSEARDERKPPGRHSSAQRRMSSRGSPNG